MKENNKIEWIQVYRGVVILLVVFGHIIWYGTTPISFSVANDIIYLFHMPAFFGLSGYLFGLKEYSQKKIIIIQKKLIQLGIPYLIFSCLYFTSKFFLQNLVRVETQVKLKDFFKILFFPNVTSSVYWFLFVLILYFILFTLIKEKKWIVFFLTIISILAYIFWKSNYIQLNNDCLQYCIGYAFCFSTGMLFGVNYKKICWKNPLFIIIFASLVFFFIVFSVPFTYKLKSIFAEKGKYMNIAIFSIFLMLGGCSFIGVLTILILKINFIKKIFIQIGNNSWYIYLLHPYFLNITRNFLVHFSRLPFFICIIISFLVGAILPLILGLIIRKVSLFDFIFYPYKYIKHKNF